MEKLSWFDDNFTKPTSATQLMKRALEFAQEEERLTKGVLFEKLDKNGPPSCENVSACAMGILVLAYGDGPLIAEFFDIGEEDVDPEVEFTIDDPIFVNATKALAKALNPDFNRKSDKGNAICVVEGTNDRSLRNEHHSKIVGAMEKALKMLRKEGK